VSFAREFLAGYPVAYETEIYPYVRHLRGFTRLQKISRRLGERIISTEDSKGNFVFELSREKPVFSDREDLKYYFFEHKFFANLYNESRDAEVFCDVGGFHGFYSLINRAELTHCFEADPINREKIRENFSLNPDKDVELIGKAVWDQNCNVELDGGKGGESQVKKESVGKTEAVTLDSFYEKRTDPDIVKIDVEGAEGRVLYGASNVLERSHPTLFIEFHLEDGLQKFNDSYEEIVEFLESLGYEFCTEINRGNEKLVVAK
jgi:FkbM family methyltransferase